MGQSVKPLWLQKLLLRFIPKPRDQIKLIGLNFAGNEVIFLFDNGKTEKISKAVLRNIL